METKRNIGTYVVLFLALLTCLVLTVRCKPTEQVQQPYTIVLPEGMEAPDSVDGWQVVRTGVNTYTYFPPKAVPKKVKYKNVGNNYSKDKSKVKDVGNTKAKGDGIIGNHNAPIEARRQAVVGDGNTVEQESNSLWWLWLLLGATIPVGLWAYRKFC